MGSEMEWVDCCPSEIASPFDQSCVKESVQKDTPRQDRSDGGERSGIYATILADWRVLPSGWGECSVATKNHRGRWIDQRLVSMIAALSVLCDNHGIRSTERLG
jgi:hypothetical protein